jgi:hypothetical protein
MKPTRPLPWLIRIGLPAALLLVLAACTPGGQFDPTTIFANDMFDTKKKLQGQREPVFPNGVPGTTSGVPADLVKGYQPPPEDTAVDANANAAQDAAAPPPKPEPKAKPKPKPKPQVAHAPTAAPTRITVSPSGAGAPASSAPQGDAAQQSPWPAPPPTAPAQRAAQPSQSIWPNPPAPKSQ